ncbi:MAG: hypothetical protein ACRC1K_19155 [Planctomycetia bacterium]
MPTAAVVAARRRRLAQLFRRGVRDLDELHRRLDAPEAPVARSVVARDLAALRDEWRQAAGATMQAALAEVLTELDELERCAWAAWEQSLSSAAGGDDGKPAGRTDGKKPTGGDPRFLKTVQWCIDQRCKLFGLHTRGRPTEARAAGDEEAGGASSARPLEIVVATRDEWLSVQQFLGLATPPRAIGDATTGE